VPIRWRLTVFNALVMGAILTAFGVSVFFLVRGALLSGVEHAVRDRAEGVARTVDTGQSLSADDVERLTLEGVFVIVRDDEGRILARTVGSAADAGEPFWRRAIRGGEPVGGQVTVSPDERGYVYAVPVEPPELESLSRSPYFYKALTAPPDRGSSDGGSQPIFGEAARIPFPSGARVVEVGKSFESAGATVATFATLLAFAISAAFFVTAGARTSWPARRSPLWKLSSSRRVESALGTSPSACPSGARRTRWDASRRPSTTFYPPGGRLRAPGRGSR